MTSETLSVFEQLTASAAPLAAAERLVQHFRAQRQPFELFEAIKMRTRIKLGLAPVASEGEPRPSDKIDQALESGLLEACREVGIMLMEDGRVREGWMYLRPLADPVLTKRLLDKIPATEENSEDLIAILLHEGIDVGRGFSLLLEQNGTCNSITTFEQVVAVRPKEQQRHAAAILLDHVYQELTSNVRGDIERQEGTLPAESDSLVDLLKGRRSLLENGAYHIDTSHLAATVRFARVLDTPQAWQKAWELTQYGRQLAPSLQYPGEEPFRDVYPTHATFFGVLLDRQRDSGLSFFERKARSIDTQEHGTAAIETYIDLLDRIGRTSDALQAALDLVPGDIPVGRMLPWVLDLAKRCGDYDRVLDYCKRREDLLGFVATMAAAKGK